LLHLTSAQCSVQLFVGVLCQCGGYVLIILPLSLTTVALTLVIVH